MLVADAYWCNLANTIEPFVFGGDAAFCQITLTTCFYHHHGHHHHHHHYVWPAPFCFISGFIPMWVIPFYSKHSICNLGLSRSQCKESTIHNTATKCQIKHTKRCTLWMKTTIKWFTNLYSNLTQRNVRNSFLNSLTHTRSFTMSHTDLQCCLTCSPLYKTKPASVTHHYHLKLIRFNISFRLYPTFYNEPMRKIFCRSIV